MAVPEWIAVFCRRGACPAGGFGRCQVPGGGCEIRGRMKAANEGADADAHGNCRLFVVSGAMPLIFSDDGDAKVEAWSCSRSEVVLRLGIESVSASPLQSS